MCCQLSGHQKPKPQQKKTPKIGKGCKPDPLTWKSETIRVLGLMDMRFKSKELQTVINNSNNVNFLVLIDCQWIGKEIIIPKGLKWASFLNVSDSKFDFSLSQDSLRELVCVCVFFVFLCANFFN